MIGVSRLTAQHEAHMECIVGCRCHVPILYHTDGLASPAHSPARLQYLIDAAIAFCNAIGMVMLVVNIQTMVFSTNLVLAKPAH